MKQAKIKGIKKYVVRLYAFLYAGWKALTISKEVLEKNDMDRNLTFLLIYRYKSIDTYGTFTLEELKQRVRSVKHKKGG